MANSIIVFLDSHEIERIPKPRGKWVAELVRKALNGEPEGEEYAFQLKSGEVMVAKGKTKMAAAMSTGLTQEQVTDGRFVRHGTVAEAREQGWYREVVPLPSQEAEEQGAGDDYPVVSQAEKSEEAPKRPTRKRVSAKGSGPEYDGSDVPALQADEAWLLPAPKQEPSVDNLFS